MKARIRKLLCSEELVVLESGELQIVSPEQRRDYPYMDGQEVLIEANELVAGGKEQREPKGGRNVV